MRRTFGALRARLRSEGWSARVVWSFLRPRLGALKRRMLGGRLAAAAGAPPGDPVLVLSHAAGTPWTGPLVTALIPTRRVSPAERTAILDALRAQTIGSVEILEWDGGPPPARGKFIVIAAAGFPALPANYLEANVLALEGEDLDFTVNAFAPAAGAEAAVAAGRIPGGPGQDAHIVARAACFDADLQFAPLRVPRAGTSAWVTGRLLLHPPAAVRVSPEAWGGRLSAPGLAFALTDRRIVARADAHRGPVPHVLYPIDTAVPIAPLPSSGRPRALVVFPFIAVGGAERLTLDVLRQLTPRFDFVVAALEPCDPSLGSMATEYRAITPHVYVLHDLIPFALNFSAVSYLIRRHGIETIFVANGSNWIYDAAGTLRAHFPKLHLVDQVYDHEVGWIERYDAALVGAFNRHIAPNRRIAAAYQARGVDEARIDLIYHGIDAAPFDPARFPPERVAALRAGFGLPVDRPVVTFPARLHAQKRPQDFLAIARRFRPEEAAFLVAGDGPLAAEIDRELRDPALSHVYRLPFHKAFEEVLAVSDVVVIPSEYEGLPLVLLMSQAMGRPVVATAVGAIREVLEMTGGGVVVDRTGDVDAIEAGVRKMLVAEIDRAAVRACIRERFDIAVVARQYGDALQPR